MALRKTPRADLKRTYGFFVQVGMIISLLLLILAFTTNIQRGDTMEIEQIEQISVQIDDILQTEQIQKPPPPPRPPVPVEVPNDEILEDDDLDLDSSLDLDAPISLPPPPPPPDEEEENDEPEIFEIVEQMPELIGGIGALQAKARYPEIARKANVEGRVIVRFVVDENGNVRDPTILRGIGGGCDIEAIRVITEHAKFVPGRQRGRAVPVKFTLPIVFKLR